MTQFKVILVCLSMLSQGQLLVATGSIARKNDTCLFKAKSMRVAAMAAAVEETRARATSLKMLIKKAELPCEGCIRYIPTKKGVKPVTLNGRDGFEDRFGNIWMKGPSRTAGERFEWDVQLFEEGLEKMEQWSKDGRHVNVSLDGTVTHGAKLYQKWPKDKIGKSRLKIKKEIAQAKAIATAKAKQKQNKSKFKMKVRKCIGSN